jgi:UDP-N-acetylglucosamine acyltransferase
MTMIHPTAIIHDGAELDENVQVGPYAVIGAEVRIGAGTSIGPHTVIEGLTEVGYDNRIFQFSSIGAIPQDLKYGGEKTHLIIGDGNSIREFSTIHLGTGAGGGETVIGNNNLLMAYSHVAHDCRLGDHCILANCATLGGHVEVHDYAILGGLSAVHQFCRIGCHCMISGGSMVAKDVLPYTIAQGDRAKPVGINLVGLQRRGFPENVLRDLKMTFKILFRSGLNTNEALERIKEEIRPTPELKILLEFFENSERGILR